MGFFLSQSVILFKSQLVGGAVASWLVRTLVPFVLSLLGMRISYFFFFCFDFFYSILSNVYVKKCKG